MDISYGSILKIIANQFKFQKDCALWVLRLQKEEHKEERFESKVKFL